MGGKSTKGPGLTMAVVASLFLHAALLYGVFSIQSWSKMPVGPLAISLRVVEREAPKATDREPGKASYETEGSARALEGGAQHRLARASSHDKPRKSSVRSRVGRTSVPTEPSPNGWASEVGGEGSRASGVVGHETSDFQEGCGLSPGADVGQQEPVIARRRAYALVVRQAIEASRSYPIGARRRRAEGEVVIRVRIGASGLVEAVEIEEPSGHSDLDRAAVKFARSVGRLPPPPGGPMWVRVPIEFSLR